MRQGVHQEPVLGPTLFSIFMLPLGQIIQKYGLGYHCYADDTHIYISTQPDVTLAFSTLSACLLEIQAWMIQNFLHLNCSKSEVLLIGTSTAVNRCNHFKFIVDDCQILPSVQARNLGVIFAAQLTCNTHFKNVIIFEILYV